jgi:hypothetical protein
MVAAILRPCQDYDNCRKSLARLHGPVSADTTLHIANLVPQTRCGWSDYSGYTQFNWCMSRFRSMAAIHDRWSINMRLEDL